MCVCMEEHCVVVCEYVGVRGSDAGGLSGKAREREKCLITARHNCPRASPRPAGHVSRELCRANTQPLCESQAEEPAFLPSEGRFNQGSRSFLQPPGGDCNAKHISV